MKLEMQGQMRLEQQMKLAPHMIQSMEILQLPILVLQERIEQELNANPVLEIEEPQDAADVETAESQQQSDADGTDRTAIEDGYRDQRSGAEFVGDARRAGPRAVHAGNGGAGGGAAVGNGGARGAHRDGGAAAAAAR